MINRIRSSIFIRYSDNFSNIINLSENKYLQIPNHLTYIHIYEIRHRRKRRGERSLRKFASPRVYTCVILLHPLVIYEWCLSTPTSSTFLWRMPYFRRWIFLDRATASSFFHRRFLNRISPSLSIDRHLDSIPSWFIYNDPSRSDWFIRVSSKGKQLSSIFSILHSSWPLRRHEIGMEINKLRTVELRGKINLKGKSFWKIALYTLLYVDRGELQIWGGNSHFEIYIYIDRMQFSRGHKLIILLYYRDETRNDFHRYRFHHFEQW